MLVFDPLAIALVIAANFAFEQNKKESEQEFKKEKKILDINEEEIKTDEYKKEDSVDKENSEYNEIEKENIEETDKYIDEKESEEIKVLRDEFRRDSSMQGEKNKNNLGDNYNNPLTLR